MCTEEIWPEKKHVTCGTEVTEALAIVTEVFRDFP
jgi:hypothetical protein